MEEAPPPPPPPQENFFPGQAGFHAVPTNLTAVFQDDGDSSCDSSEPESSPLQDYLVNLVLRVQGRIDNGIGGSSNAPLTAAEMAELSLRASRDDDAFGSVESDTLTPVAEWLYQHVLLATSVSILEEAGRVFTKGDAAPSEAMAALHRVSDMSFSFHTMRRILCSQTHFIFSHYMIVGENGRNSASGIIKTGY